MGAEPNLETIFHRTYLSSNNWKTQKSLKRRLWKSVEKSIGL